MCVVFGILGVALPTSASASKTQRVHGYPAGCEGTAGTLASDGSLWLNCSSNSRSTGGLIHVSTAGIVSRPVRLPSALTTPKSAGPSPRGGGASVAGPAGSLWMTNGSGVVCDVTPAGRSGCAQTASSLKDPSEMEILTITEGADGIMWLLQERRTNDDALSDASIVRVTAALSMTEYQAPAGWNYLGGLVKSASGDMWFGGGSTVSNTQGIGFITPSGEVTSFPLIPEAVDSPEPTIALPSGIIYYITGDNIERLDRVLPNGSQSIILKAHTQLALIGAPKEGAWVLAQSQKAGLGKGYYKPGTIYHLNVAGAATAYPLSGRFELTDFQLGLNEQPWAIASGDLEDKPRIVSVSPSGSIVTEETFNRTTGYVPLAIYASPSLVWVVSTQRARAYHMNYVLSRITD
jgi:hypothetical protein